MFNKNYISTLVEEEEETPGHCAFDILLTKNVPHILEKIFFCLDYESFKNCIEVSNAWEKLLTSASYQKKGKILFGQDIHQDLLWLASRDGNVLRVKRLISSEMVNVNYKRAGWTRYYHYINSTPLQEAALYGHKEVAKVLLDGGADPYIETRLRGPPLLRAAMAGKVDVIKVLLNGGTDPNKPNSRGHYPLHAAAIYGNVDSVTELLDGGADLNKEEPDGNSPLHYAAQHGHKKVVNILLQRGANNTKANEDGHTPLSLARENEQWKVVEIIQFHDAKLI